MVTFVVVQSRDGHRQTGGQTCFYFFTYVHGLCDFLPVDKILR